MTRFNLRYAALAVVLAGSIGLANAGEVKVHLTGAQEVPAVKTKAKASGEITVSDDKSVAGKITAKGIDGTMAHIHMAPKGKNGPPIITLEKGADGTWTVPEGSKLSDEQYAAFKKGDLYVNIHSAEHKGGEIRTQLKP